MGFAKFAFASLIFFPSALFASPIDSLVNPLARAAVSSKQKKVAVLSFPYHDGRVSSGSSILPEQLTTELAQRKGVQVIERRLMQQLLAEEKLSETGVIDPSGIKTIGSILDVETVVTGTLIDNEDGTTEVNARLIDVKTGEVLAASQGLIKRTWDDEPVTVRKSREPSVDESTLSPDEIAEMNSLNKSKALAKTATAPVKSRKAMTFSNESFPAGRRIYHGGQPPPKMGLANNKLSAADDDYADDSLLYRALMGLNKKPAKYQAPAKTNSYPSHYFPKTYNSYPTSNSYPTNSNSSNAYPSYYAPPPPPAKPNVPAPGNTNSYK